MKNSLSFAEQTMSGAQSSVMGAQVKRDFDTEEDIPEQILECPRALKTPYMLAC